jgi:hypothetical protein
VKVTPKGARVYVLKYRAAGSQRWLTLGRHGEITAEEARTKAVKLRGAIADGKDPSRIRDDAAAAPTVDELADRYLAEHAAPHKKPRSIEEDRRNLVLHVRPNLGDLKAGEVTRQDILRLHYKLRVTPTAANRVQALLSKMFELAEAWGIRPEASNPCRRVPKYTERSRDRFLSTDELNRLGEALDAAERDGEHPRPEPAEPAPQQMRPMNALGETILPEPLREPKAASNTRLLTVAITRFHSDPRRPPCHRRS